MPVILPTPPKRKRKKPARPGDEDDDGAVNLAAQKKRKASSDGAKPRKARSLHPSHQVSSISLMRCASLASAFVCSAMVLHMASASRAELHFGDRFTNSASAPQVMRMADGQLVSGAAGESTLRSRNLDPKHPTMARFCLIGLGFRQHKRKGRKRHSSQPTAHLPAVTVLMEELDFFAVADADGKAPASAKKSKGGGAGGYEMAPELRKVVDAMRAAVAELPLPPEDDRKQGLPQVIKDLLPALAGHLTRCASRPPSV